jgi:hypothetical protein
MSDFATQEIVPTDELDFAESAEAGKCGFGKLYHPKQQPEEIVPSYNLTYQDEFCAACGNGFDADITCIYWFRADWGDIAFVHQECHASPRLSSHQVHRASLSEWDEPELRQLYASFDDFKLENCKTATVVDTYPLMTTSFEIKHGVLHRRTGISHSRRRWRAYVTKRLLDTRTASVTRCISDLGLDDLRAREFRDPEWIPDFCR